MNIKYNEKDFISREELKRQALESEKGFEEKIEARRKEELATQPETKSRDKILFPNPNKQVKNMAIIGARVVPKWGEGMINPQSKSFKDNLKEKEKYLDEVGQNPLDKYRKPKR